MHHRVEHNGSGYLRRQRQALIASSVLYTMSFLALNTLLLIASGNLGYLCP